jgi:hypothetical protein
MRHHIDFSRHPLKKNYVGSLKHHLFEKLMPMFSDYQNGKIIRLPSKNGIQRIVDEHIFQNPNLIKYRVGATPPLEEIWNDIKRDFYNFAFQCKNFAVSYINTNQGIRFRTHLGKVAELHINSVEKTEFSIRNEALGIRGKVDVLFRCEYTPDVQNFPEEVYKRLVIADLKTGEFTKKNNHQILYYMMGYFGEDLDDQLGIVLYSKSQNNNKGFSLDFVFPYKQYFKTLIIHRNMFAAKNYEPSQSLSSQHFSRSLYSLSQSDTLDLSLNSFRIPKARVFSLKSFCEKSVKIFVFCFLLIFIYRSKFLNSFYQSLFV